MRSNQRARIDVKTSYRRTIAAFLVVSMAGCAAPRQLAREHRPSFSPQTKVHAVHYAPAEVFMPRDHTAASLALRTPGVRETMRMGEALQRSKAVVDPAPQLESRLVRALQANVHLANVQIATDLPPNDDVGTLKELFKTGNVLDVRTMKWGYTNYSARARLVDLSDSTILWEATCSVPAAAGLHKAAEDCAAQLAGAALGVSRKAVSVRGAVPDAHLLAPPRIEVDGQPVQITGFDISAEERAKYEEQRAARIDAAGDAAARRATGGPPLAQCVLLLPCLVATGAAAVVAGGVARAKASAEPSLIPEKEGARLEAVLKERATSAALAERMRRLSWPASAPAAAQAATPRLVVRLKAAQAAPGGRGVFIVAQAQAFPAAGAEWAPTEHRYELSSAAWTANDPASVQGEVDGALDALAESITWTYLSILPPAGSAGERRSSEAE